MHVNSVPSGCKLERVFLAHALRTEGSSAHRKVQSQMTSASLPSRKCNAMRCSTPTWEGKGMPCLYWLYLCIYICVCVSVYTSVCVYIYICRHIHIHIHVHIHIHIHIYIYVCMYTYIYTITVYKYIHTDSRYFLIMKLQQWYKLQPVASRLRSMPWAPSQTCRSRHRWSAPIYRARNKSLRCHMKGQHFKATILFATGWLTARICPKFKTTRIIVCSAAQEELEHHVVSVNSRRGLDFVCCWALAFC